MVTVMPNKDCINIELESSVFSQYGESIITTIREVAASMNISAAKIVAYDRGALDCTIRARVETALRRAAESCKED